MYQISFYVPETHLELVKNALFAAGAGQIGAYEQCCWQTLGQGQFRPLLGSQPFAGRALALEKVVEYKVELVCADAYLTATIAALKQAHPYETPSYAVWRLTNV